MMAGIVAGGRPLAPLVPPPVAVAHAHWRILITAVKSGAYATLAEVEMRETAGGLDLCVGGIVSASSTIGYPYDPPKAFDGSTGTAWASAGTGAPWWIAYAFASPVAIIQVALTVFDDHIDAYNDNPKGFAIQYSDDGTTWVTEWSVSGQTGWSFYETRLFSKP